MKDSGIIAKRYAEALFGLCLKEKNLEQVEKAFGPFVRETVKNPRLIAFMESPGIPHKAKEEMLAKIIPGDMPVLLKLFLKLILAKKRFNNLKNIQEAFEERAQKHHGIHKAEFIGASALETGSQKKLISILEKKLSSKINLVTKTDPKLVGGFILKLDERVIDASYQTQLREMKQQLYAAAI